MYNPYEPYESGNQQYYPPVPQQNTFEATPSFDCDMNAYGYQSTNPAPFNNQYCPPYYPPEAYNGGPNPMQSFPAASPNLYPAGHDYYNYNSFVPNNAFSGTQPPIFNQNPVPGVSTSYPQNGLSGLNYSAHPPSMFNQNPVPSLSFPQKGQSGSNYSEGQPPIFHQKSVPKDRSSDSNYSQSVAVNKSYGTPSSYQSSAKSKQRLPSPDSFIKECLSGKKSNERLKKEEMIENSIQKTFGKESEFRKNGESSHGNSNYGFVAAKKTSFKSRQRSPGNNDSHQGRKKWEFIKRWRYSIFLTYLCSYSVQLDKLRRSS